MAKWFEKPYLRIKEGGEARRLHEIFQKHSLTPTDIYSLPEDERNFIYASMKIAEEDRNKDLPSKMQSNIF